MPKKAKKASAQSKGWETRRAQANATKLVTEPGVGVVGPLVTTMAQPAEKQIKRLRSMLEKVPSPTAKIAPGPINQSTDAHTRLTAEVMTAARKKGGAAKVEHLIRIHSQTQHNNGADQAWRHHTDIMSREKRVRRDEIITDFIVMAETSGAAILHLGRTTRMALLEALYEAGYTQHGKRSQQDAAEKAVGR